MKENSSLIIEILKISFQFITTNIWPFVIILSIIVLRDALSEFVKRIINFSFKKGTTEVGLAACLPKKATDLDKGKTVSVSAVKKMEEPAEIKKIEEKKDGDNWFSVMFNSLANGDVEKAKSAFKEYYVGEDDETKRMENENFFLYLLYSKAGERDSVKKLISLSDKAKDESSKLRTLYWASLCYRDSNNSDAEIKLWKKTLPKLEESSNITDCITYYSYSLVNTNMAKEALELLKERLTKINDDKEIVTIYKAMAIAEKSLGNGAMAALCKEKVLQYMPDDNELLFETAYAESESDLKALSICNYATLIKLDQKNATAFNNLGVCASEYKINTKAYDFYLKAKELGNTLSSANLGYKLLEIGFHQHALDLTKEAQEKKETHQNIYSLITKISEDTKSENDKWDELRKRAAIFQFEIRKYTAYYYDEIEHVEEFFSGIWYTESWAEITVEAKEGNLKSKWYYTSGLIDQNKREVTINGTYNNRSAQLRYQEKNVSDQPNYRFLLGIGDKDVSCYSYLDDNATVWHIFSKDIEAPFELKLKREKHNKSIE